MIDPHAADLACSPRHFAVQVAFVIPLAYPGAHRLLQQHLAFAANKTFGIGFAYLLSQCDDFRRAPLFDIARQIGHLRRQCPFPAGIREHMQLGKTD